MTALRRSIFPSISMADSLRRQVGKAPQPGIIRSNGAGDDGDAGPPRTAPPGGVTGRAAKLPRPPTGFAVSVSKMPMFKRLETPANSIRFEFDGALVIAAEGDSVAAALLAHGVERFRTTPVSGAPRQPHCMIGNCFDCLVQIDGVPNCQACMVLARAGMKVTHQDGPGEMELL